MQARLAGTIQKRKDLGEQTSAMRLAGEMLLRTRGRCGWAPAEGSGGEGCGERNAHSEKIGDLEENRNATPGWEQRVSRVQGYLKVARVGECSPCDTLPVPLFGLLDPLPALAGLRPPPTSPPPGQDALPVVRLGTGIGCSSEAVGESAPGTNGGVWPQVGLLTEHFRQPGGKDGRVAAATPSGAPTVSGTGPEVVGITGRRARSKTLGDWT